MRPEVERLWEQQMQILNLNNYKLVDIEWTAEGILLIVENS